MASYDPSFSVQLKFPSLISVFNAILGIACYYLSIWWNKTICIVQVAELDKGEVMFSHHVTLSLVCAPCCQT